MDIQGDLPKLTAKFIAAGFDAIGKLYPSDEMPDRPDEETAENLREAVEAAVADWLQKSGHMKKVNRMAQRVLSGEWKNDRKNESTQIREIIREEIQKIIEENEE